MKKLVGYIGGIRIGHVERLTNIRFADGRTLYSKAESELVSMLETLSQELRKVGLPLNPQRTTILTTKLLTSPTFLDVEGDITSVLHGEKISIIILDASFMVICNTAKQWNAHIGSGLFQETFEAFPGCHYPKSSLQILALFSVACYNSLLVGGVLTMKTGQTP